MLLAPVIPTRSMLLRNPVLRLSGCCTAINAQLTNVRQMLATLSGGGMANLSEHAEPEPAVPATEQSDRKAGTERQSVVTDVQGGEDTAHTDDGPDIDEGSGEQADDEQADDHSKAPRQAAAVKG
jgi:hypothetical protein